MADFVLASHFTPMPSFLAGSPRNVENPSEAVVLTQEYGLLLIMRKKQLESKYSSSPKESARGLPQGPEDLLGKR